MIELHWNTTVRSVFAPAAELAPRLLYARLEQPVLQVVGARPAIGDENLFQRQWDVGTKRKSDVPSLAEEVARIELEVADATPDVFEVSTSRNESKFLDRLSEAPALGNRPSKIIVIPAACFATVSRISKMRRCKPKSPDVPMKLVVAVAMGLDSNPPQNFCHRPRTGNGNAKLVV